MNKSSTRGCITLVHPGGKETLVPSTRLFNIFGNGPLFFNGNTEMVPIFSLKCHFVITYQMYNIDASQGIHLADLVVGQQVHCKAGIFAVY